MNETVRKNAKWANRGNGETGGKTKRRMGEAPARADDAGKCPCADCACIPQLATGKSGVVVNNGAGPVWLEVPTGTGVWQLVYSSENGWTFIAVN